MCVCVHVGGGGVTGAGQNYKREKVKSMRRQDEGAKCFLVTQ